MANGQVDQSIKLYLYSQQVDNGVFLMEFLLNTSNNDIQITLKSDRADIAEAYAVYILSSLGL